MADVYLRDDLNVRRTPPLTLLDDPPFIVAVNIAAGWLYEIACRFFWAALAMMLVLAEFGLHA